LLVLAIVVGVPVWLVMVAAIALFAIIRPIAALASGLVLAGSAIAIAYCAAKGWWSEAGHSAILAAVSGAVFFATTALADRLGLESHPSFPAPPWWWWI
jgi:hypothetical protein